MSSFFLHLTLMTLCAVGRFFCCHLLYLTTYLVKSVLCFLNHPEKVHCSTKDAYTSEIIIILWIKEVMQLTLVFNYREVYPGHCYYSLFVWLSCALQYFTSVEDNLPCLNALHDMLQRFPHHIGLFIALNCDFRDKTEN